MFLLEIHLIEDFHLSKTVFLLPLFAPSARTRFSRRPTVGRRAFGRRANEEALPYDLF